MKQLLVLEQINIQRLDFIGLYYHPEEPFPSQVFVLHLDDMFSHWSLKTC